MAPKIRENLALYPMVFGFFIVLIGLYLLSVGLINGFKQMLTYNWSEVSGQVISIFHNEWERGEHTGSPVLYKYVVNGLEYYSDRVIYVDVINLEDNEWISLANGISTFRSLRVFVDPEDPESSVLRTGANKLSWSGMMPGSMLVGFGTVFSIGFWWVSKEFG